MRRRIQKATWFLVVPLLLGAFASGAQAIEYGGIGGRPANPDPNVPRSDQIFIYDLPGGTVKDDAITLLNNTDQTKTLKVYATDSLVSSGGALSCRQEAEPKEAVGEWISLSESEVTLAPFTNQAVPFTVTVPADAEPGEHNGCIAVQDVNQTPQQQAGGIALSTRTAIRVAVTVPGEITRSIAITKHRIKSGPKGGFLDQVGVKNDGNVSVETDVKTTVHYFFGPVYSRSGGKFSILPRVTADYNFDIKKPFWGLVYFSTVKATYKPDTGSDQTKTVSGPIRVFWAWPHPLAAVIELLVLAAIIIGARLYRRRRHDRAAVGSLVTYTTKRGDTLQSVASRAGIPIALLAKINDVTPSYRLKARQRIKVPAGAPLTSSRTPTRRSKRVGRKPAGRTRSARTRTARTRRRK